MQITGPEHPIDPLDYVTIASLEWKTLDVAIFWTDKIKNITT